MQKTKDYAVNYNFQGGGTIIVSGATKAEAEENARIELAKMTDQLRPSTVHVYKSQIEALKEGHGKTHARDIYSKYNHLTHTSGPTQEPFEATTPPKVY
ncbi:MAG: hypothetical protein QMC36_06380 [Patescibacteria group bacterium]